MSEFIQQLINGLSLGAIYALIALGYTMVYGVLRFINFAHGDVYMLGAFAGFYFAPWVWKWLPASADPESLTWQTVAGAVVVLLLSMAICAAVGVAIERLVYRPLRERPRLTVLITAIGVSIFLENFGQYYFGAEPKSFPEILPDRLIEGLGDLVLMRNQVIVFVTTALLLFALHFVVMKTRVGMAMRALSFNTTAASLMGVNNDRVIAFTFAVCSALAAAGGILQAVVNPSIDPLMGILPGIKAFVAAVMGGIGNLAGAVVGGLILGVLETMVVGYGSPMYRDAIVYTMMVLILLLCPNGIFGKTQKEKV